MRTHSHAPKLFLPLGFTSTHVLYNSPSAQTHTHTHTQKHQPPHHTHHTPPTTHHTHTHTRTRTRTPKRLYASIHRDIGHIHIHAPTSSVHTCTHIHPCNDIVLKHYSHRSVFDAPLCGLS